MVHLKCATDSRPKCNPWKVYMPQRTDLPVVLLGYKKRDGNLLQKQKNWKNEQKTPEKIVFSNTNPSQM